MISILYMVAVLVAGAFYREFDKIVEWSCQAVEMVFLIFFFIETGLKYYSLQKLILKEKVVIADTIGICVTMVALILDIII